MTDLEAACVIRELIQWNREGVLQTPIAARSSDKLYDGALVHALYALLEHVHADPATPRGSFEFMRQADGSYTTWASHRGKPKS